MSFFKINSLPGTTWPSLPQYSLLWSAYQELSRTQWLSAQEIETMQIKQINTLLKHCYDNSPFYKLSIAKTLGKPSINSIDDFRKLSTLSRLEFQSYYELIKAKKVPDGMIVGKSPIYTSGTTGVPVQLYKTNRDELWWQALAMRDFEWTRMDPSKKAAAIKLLAMSPDKLEESLSGIQTPTWFPSNLFESTPVYGVDIRLDPAKQLEWLAKTNPNYLISLPSNLDVLSKMFKSSNYRLSNLEMIQTIGETLSPDVKTNIERNFGVPVKNLYSSNECGYMASDCPEGHGMHVHAEGIFAEVLNDDNNLCKPGETGRLVVTSLTNFINPFIRYEIMDYVTLGDGPCPCGRGLPLWKSVDGRMHPMLFLPDGRRKASTGIMLGIRQIGGVHQFQVTQKSAHHCILNVVPNGEWSADKCNEMIQCIRNEIENPNANVEVRGYKYLDRANGKLKIIIVEEDNGRTTQDLG